MRYFELVLQLFVAAHVIVELHINWPLLHEDVQVFLLSNGAEQLFLVHGPVWVSELLVHLPNLRIADNEVSQVELLEDPLELLLVELYALLVVYAHGLLQSHEAVPQDQMHFLAKGTRLLSQCLLILQLERLEVDVWLGGEADELLDACRDLLLKLVVRQG